MTARSPARRALVTCALGVGTFLSSLDVTVVGTAMPTIARDLEGISLYGWVFAAYLLSSTVSVPLYGKLADLWGRKRAYFLGLAIFLLGSAACGAAPSMAALVGARALQGLGAGALIPITLVAIGDLYSMAQRARVLGAFSLVWGVSSVVGPTVGGLLVGLGWPWIFFVNLPLGGVAFALLAALWRDDYSPRPMPIDFSGAALVVAASLCALFAMRALSAGGWALAALLGCAAAILGAVFVRVEGRARDPILPPALVKDRLVGVAMANGLALGASLFVAIAFVPLYLRGVLGYGPAAAGAAFIPMSFLWSAGAYGSASLMERLGYRAPVRLGALLVASGTGIIAAAAFARSGPAMIAAAGILGAGMGLSVTALNVTVQDRAPVHLRGAATAATQFSRTMGGMLGVSALGALLAVLTRAPVDLDAGAFPEPEALEAALLRVLGAGGLAGLSALALSIPFPRHPPSGKILIGS